MKVTRRHYLALVTVPNRRVARDLTRRVLTAHAAACANIVPGVESHYWWKGKLESAAELLIIFKTTPKRLAELESIVLSHHPYETAEVVAFPLASGTPRYLAWLDENLP